MALTAIRGNSTTVSSLMNETVRNPRGEDLGRMEDYVVDVPTGRIEYGLLGFGGFLGMGEHRVAVPYSSIHYDAEQRCYILDTTREHLQKAPPFDAGRASGDTYVRELHDYWSVEYPSDKARPQRGSRIQGEPHGGEQPESPAAQRGGREVPQTPGERTRRSLPDDYYRRGSGSTDRFGEGPGGTAGGYPTPGGTYFAQPGGDPAREEAGRHLPTRGEERDDAGWGLDSVTSGTSEGGGMGRGSEVMGDYSPSGGSVTEDDRKDENEEGR